MPKLTQPRNPTYAEEAALLDSGYAVVAGVDEVGRGPLAGPVVAGAAILPPHPVGEWVSLIRDSKQLTHHRRQIALDHMQAASVTMRTAAATSREVDALGIVEATRVAMARAIAALPIAPDFLLIDALPLPNVRLPQRAIVKGDAKCLSIAAASIAAKLARDRMMQDADAAFPGYGFARHKGYGTRQHLSSLERLGACAIHRYTFAPVRHMACALP